MSLFVVFEGPDGAGKSTQVNLLADELRARDYAVVTTREPGGTPVGDAVREVMFGDDAAPMRPATWAFLMNAARSELVADVVKPALARGDVVISDRYWYSTMAYQSGGDRLEAEVVKELSGIATGGLEADLVILLDLPARVGLDRKAGGVMNQLDKRPIDFHERVREAYAKMAAGDPGRWVTVDAAQPPEALAAQVLERTLARLEPVRAAALGR